MNTVSLQSGLHTTFADYCTVVYGTGRVDRYGTVSYTLTLSLSTTIAEMRKMTQDTKKFAPYLDFCRKLLDKKYLQVVSVSKKNGFNWLSPSFQ